MDIRGEGGGHNRGEVNKIFVDNSKMVMYCQRTAKTCEGNEIASILMLPQQSFNSGIGKDKKLTAAKATLLLPSGKKNERSKKFLREKGSITRMLMSNALR